MCLDFKLFNYKHIGMQNYQFVHNLSILVCVSKIYFYALKTFRFVFVLKLKKND